MNLLSLTTNPTNEPYVYDTCWMTGLVQKGRVRVQVPRVRDARTAAELSVAQYLLEKKNVCGHNKAGAGLTIRTSCKTISRLAVGTAEDRSMAPYANFLRTRFLGATIESAEAEAPYAWADELCEQNIDVLEIHEPHPTVIEVTAVGPVILTAHAVEKYVERFERKEVKAWREISRIAGDGKLAKLEGRNVLHDIKHRQQGSYVLDSKREVMLVIAKPDRVGDLPRLVTIVRPDSNAKVLKD